MLNVTFSPSLFFGLGLIFSFVVGDSFANSSNLRCILGVML